MTGLLYRELRLHWKNLLVFTICMMAYPVLITVMCVTGDEETVPYEISYMLFGLGGFIAFLVGGAFENLIFTDNGRKKWAYFVASTPTGVKGQIGAKYLFTLIDAMLITTLLILNNCLAMEGKAKIGDSSLIFVGLFYMQLLMRAIEFPLVARFGGKTGNAVKITIVGVVALVIFVYGLFGDTSAFSDMPNFWETLFKTMNDPEKMKKKVLLFSIITTEIIPIYYLSYRLSVKWYLKGVENYAK